MICEISSFGYACMLAKIFLYKGCHEVYQGLGPSGPWSVTTPLYGGDSRCNLPRAKFYFRHSDCDNMAWSTRLFYIKAFHSATVRIPAQFVVRNRFICAINQQTNTRCKP